MFLVFSMQYLSGIVSITASFNIAFCTYICIFPRIPFDLTYHKSIVPRYYSTQIVCTDEAKLIEFNAWVGLSHTHQFLCKYVLYFRRLLFIDTKLYLLDVHG